LEKQGKKQKFRSYFTLLAGLSFMCFAAIYVKSAHAPGIVTAFYRMVIGTGILIIPFLIHRFKTEEKLPLKGVLFAVAGGLCFGGDMTLWSTAVVMSNATLPTLMANLAPVWVGIAALFIFREKNNAIFWVGLATALGGVIILGSKDFVSYNGILKGALLGLGAGFFYAGFYMVSQPGRKLLNTLSYVFIFTLSAATLLFVVMLILKYHFTGYDQHTNLMFLGIGLGVQVCGWLLINYSQGFLPATIVAPTLLGQPVLTAILAWSFLNEHLTSRHITGGLIVMTGIYVVHYGRKKQA
jgi:drug/metabolite transporter (DMT)-like permease